MEIMEFPKKLESLLARRKLSQKEVGTMIGVDQARISEWITGKSKRRPPLDVAYRLAQVLDVPVEYLADDESDNPPVLLTDEERKILEYIRRIGTKEAYRRLDWPDGTVFKAAGGTDMPTSDHKPGRQNKRPKGPDVPGRGR
jgi:transcriptional regulator with XRE-family HTH domain